MIPLAAEGYRLRRLGSTWVLLLLPLAIGVARILVELASERLASATSAASDALGTGASEEAGGFALLADGLRAGAGAVTFAALLLGALAIVRDRESGLLAQMFLARRRAACVVAKALALLAFVVASFALLFAGCALLAQATRGLGPVLIEGYEVADVGKLWDDTIRGALASLPPMIAASWFALLVSACAGSAGFAVALSLVPFVTYDVLKGLLRGAADWVFASYAPLLSDGSPLHRLTDLARAYANVDWAPGELRLSALVPAVEGVLLVVAAAWITRVRPA